MPELPEQPSSTTTAEKQESETAPVETSTNIDAPQPSSENTSSETAPVEPVAEPVADEVKPTPKAKKSKAKSKKSKQVSPAEPESVSVEATPVSVDPEPVPEPKPAEPEPEPEPASVEAEPTTAASTEEVEEKPPAKKRAKRASTKTTKSTSESDESETKPKKPARKPRAKKAAAPTAAPTTEASNSAENPAADENGPTPDISEAADEIFVTEQADANGFALVRADDDATDGHDNSIGAAAIATPIDASRPRLAHRAVAAEPKDDNTAELLAQLIEKLDDPSQTPRRNVWPAAAAVGLIVGLGAGIAISSVFPGATTPGPSLDAINQPASPNAQSLLPAQATPGTTVAPLVEMKGTTSQESNLVDLQGGEVTLQYASDAGQFQAQLADASGLTVGPPVTCEGPCNTKITIPHSPGQFKVIVNATNSNWSVSLS